MTATNDKPRSVANVGTRFYPVRIGDKTHMGHCPVWLMSDGSIVEYSQASSYCGSKKWGGRQPVKVGTACAKIKLTCTKCNPDGSDIDFEAINAQEIERTKDRVAECKARHPEIFGGQE